MSARIVSFVMSGGFGSRLWPLSREDNPKQFHDLIGGGSMLRQTVRRLAARTADSDPIYVIAAERHFGQITAELAQLDLRGGRAVLEPMGRNTAAVVALATQVTLRDFGDDLTLVVPSDHVIRTDADFWATVEDAASPAATGSVVVFGIRPTHPETGYGYIEVEMDTDGMVQDVARFVEKPDRETAETYVDAGTFFWNAGIFLFRASAMKEAFERFEPTIWSGVGAALASVRDEPGGEFLPEAQYGEIRSDSIDYAIMEKLNNISMVEARFSWSDLGSWQSLLEASDPGENGNVVVGNVVALGCERSYLHSTGGLISAVGLKDMVVVSTADAVLVAPIAESQSVKSVVEKLDEIGRREVRFSPGAGNAVETGSWVNRVRHWLFEETLPLWSTNGVDRVHGGFHETLGFDGLPKSNPKRMRTMARQIYVFSVAKLLGWDGPADELIAHGIDFINSHGRTHSGGWVRTFNPDGSVLDSTEDVYDHAFVLLALAHATKAGHPGAEELGRQTFDFLKDHLEDDTQRGYFETPERTNQRRSNPHMHLLEAFLAWYTVTGERLHLRRAVRVVDLFRDAFFDTDTWTLGEFFDANWIPEASERGQWTEPGHQFEWASLLVDFGNVTAQTDLLEHARKLYATGIAYGLNRTTGLAYNAVSRFGVPIDRMSRSWPQAEAVKAEIALRELGGTREREIEDSVARLFRCHIDPAPKGLWVDVIDERGMGVSDDVPASILYHLVSALERYLKIRI